MTGLGAHVCTLNLVMGSHTFKCNERLMTLKCISQVTASSLRSVFIHPQHRTCHLHWLPNKYLNWSNPRLWKRVPCSSASSSSTSHHRLVQRKTRENFLNPFFSSLHLIHHQHACSFFQTFSKSFYFPPLLWHSYCFLSSFIVGLLQRPLY